MASFFSEIFSPITNLASKLILDKDKAAELAFKREDNKHAARMALLQVTTTPNIDATVKILMALRDVVIPMFRPLGSIAMAMFAAYCLDKGIILPDAVQAALFGAPLAWGTSRHFSKDK